jgi:hypothetical protein
MSSSKRLTKKGGRTGVKNTRNRASLGSPRARWGSPRGIPTPGTRAWFEWVTSYVLDVEARVRSLETAVNIRVERALFPPQPPRMLLKPGEVRLELPQVGGELEATVRVSELLAALTPGDPDKAWKALLTKLHDRGVHLDEDTFAPVLSEKRLR